jgi:hypothetical protein
MSIEVG